MTTVASQLNNRAVKFKSRYPGFKLGRFSAKRTQKYNSAIIVVNNCNPTNGGIFYESVLTTQKCIIKQLKLPEAKPVTGCRTGRFSPQNRRGTSENFKIGALMIYKNASTPLNYGNM